MACRISGPLSPKCTRCEAGRGGHWGRAREFSMNLFFRRLRSFDSPTPQRALTSPPPPPALPPAPSLLLAITRGDLTPCAPSFPPSPGLWVCQQKQAQGGHLCAGHRMLGARREGGSSPLPQGSATVPFLILRRLKCNDGPLPSFAKGSLPCHSEAVGPGRQDRGAEQEEQQWLLPALLGTKCI